MTWGAVFIATRNGITQRSGQAGRRAVNQTKPGNRSASSQVKPVKETPKETSSVQDAKQFLPEEWDFMILDVCFSAKL